MNELTKFLVDGILNESVEQITALFGGGFKPPTKGHLDVVLNGLKQNPEINNLKIIVGGGVRDGITQDQSARIWELYRDIGFIPVETEIIKASPFNYYKEYLRSNPDSKTYVFIGSREGSEGDQFDLNQRTQFIKKYSDNVVPVEISTTGGISGTEARKLFKTDLESFKDMLPEKLTVGDIKRIVDILNGKSKDSTKNPSFDRTEPLTPLNENISLYLDIPKFNQLKTTQQHLVENISEISLSKENAVDTNGDLTGGNFKVGDITYEYNIKNIDNPYKDSGVFYNIQFTPKGEVTSTPKGGKENYIKILSTMYKIIVDFLEKEKPEYIGISSLDGSRDKNYHTVYNRLTDNPSNLIPGYFRKDSNLTFNSPQGKGRFIVLKRKKSLNKTEPLSPLNEGRYDTISNKISSDIFTYWKNNLTDRVITFTNTYQHEGEDIDVEATLKQTPEIEYLNVDGGADDETDYILVSFEVNPYELPQALKDISFNLKDVIRHEIEHLTHGEGFMSKSGKYMENDEMIRKMIDMEFLPKSSYFTLEKEVDANLQGMYFRAKKEKRPFRDVIDVYLDAQKITPEEKEKIINLWSKRTRALGLPSIDNKENINESTSNLRLVQGGAMVPPPPVLYHGTGYKIDLSSLNFSRTGELKVAGNFGSKDERCVGLYSYAKMYDFNPIKGEGVMIVQQYPNSSARSYAMGSYIKSKTEKAYVYKIELDNNIMILDKQAPGCFDKKNLEEYVPNTKIKYKEFDGIGTKTGEIILWDNQHIKSIKPIIVGVPNPLLKSGRYAVAWKGLRKELNTKIQNPQLLWFSSEEKANNFISNKDKWTQYILDKYAPMGSPKITQNPLTEELLNEIDLKKYVDKAKSGFKKFIGALKQEGKETKEAFKLLAQSVKGEKQLSKEEKKEIGNQLKDVFKTIGYLGLFALPGGSIFTILFNLLKLNKYVLPSAFQPENLTENKNPLYYEFQIVITPYESEGITFLHYDGRLIKSSKNVDGDPLIFTYKNVPSLIKAAYKVKNDKSTITIWDDTGKGKSHPLDAASIKLIKKQSLTEASGDKILYAFDLDDTLITSNSSVIVTNPKQGTFKLTPAEYALYEPGPDDELDFSEFAYLKDPKVIKDNFNLFSQILNKSSKLSGAKTIILTARQPEVSTDVEAFLEQNNLPQITLHAVGSSDPNEKLKVIEDYIDQGFNKIRFYDDSPKNVKSIKSISRPGVDVVSKLVKHGPLSERFLNEAIVGDKIECDKCDWSWDIKDGGDDLYMCHKCGYDNEPLNESISPFSKNIEENILSDIKEYGDINEYKIDLKNTYSYNQSGDFFQFKDEINNLDVIVKLKPVSKDIVEFKFYPVKDDKPLGFIRLPKSNPKIMNTIFKIFMDEILPNNPKILIQPSDYTRYRLFRAMLNNNLDGSEYKVNTKDNPTEQSFLLIQKLNESKDPFGLIQFVNEVAEESEFDYTKHIDSLNDYMVKNKMNVSPLPKVTFIDDDVENANDVMGKTAYYDPNKREIVLYTLLRHPKDILRSYAHEMIHHIQNLEDRLGNITTTNTTEDDNLTAIEKEAYTDGNLTFRKWTETINEITNQEMRYWAFHGDIFSELRKGGVEKYNEFRKLAKGERLQAIEHFWDLLEKGKLTEYLAPQEEVRIFNENCGCNEA